MQPKTGKTYFLRQGTRITGPFSLLKLTAMYRTGSLTYEDMCSEDKCKWHYIGILFPDLTPPVPIALSSAPASPFAAIENCDNADSLETFSSTPEETAKRVEAIPPPPIEDGVKTETCEARSAWREWLMDIGRTFALLWNFQEIHKKYVKKATRFYCIALSIHFLLSIAFISLFGRYYSSKYHIVLSNLMGISLLALLCGTASLTGWMVAKYCTPPGEKTLPSWKICAAGIFMDYGTIACCVMALAHGIRYFWVQLLLVFINNAILCSSAMQLRDYLEEHCKEWKIPVICSVLILNPVSAVIIYYFTTLI